MKTKTKLYGQLVHKLIYPAILGSMLYELSDLKELQNQGLWLSIALLLVAILYIADYVAINIATPDAITNEQTILGISADLAAAIFFRTAYSLIEFKWYWMATLALILVSISFWVYNEIRNVRSFHSYFFFMVVLGFLCMWEQFVNPYRVQIMLIVYEFMFLVAYGWYIKIRLKEVAPERAITKKSS